MYRELQNSIRKSGKFTLIDRAVRKQVTQNAIDAVDAGEGAAAIGGVGSYTAADLVITGELRKEQTQEGDVTVYHHFLNLMMTDSSDGTLFWSESIPVTKFKNNKR